ncbi:MAG TPA: glycosyl transferase [Bacteroides sp.]|nr:glycosyl transferase [Bacteroides sp.]
MDPKSEHNRLVYFFIFTLAVLAHLTGLLNELFISDSALYASIAKEMAISNNFLELTYDGVDWLDKPHLQFWITALSFKILGINAFAYKLPAILFTFLAFFYTYKFARELYNRETALLAVLILATAEHLVISNNDVRAEPYLTGLIIASIYHYYRMLREFRFSHLLLASFFGGMAVMTKGLFTLIPIIGAVGGELIIKRNWKDLLSWKWILSLGLIVLFVSPELYTLYFQFDSHPEKIIFGSTGVSGIRFFLWDSQVGRFFNTGPITGNGDPFFFLHTLIWAFLPWAILMYYSLYRKIRNNLPRLDKGQEFYTLAGIIVTLLLFSLSSFQLPHYTNVIFPLLAIITAGFIQKKFTRRESRFYTISQWSNIFIILVLLLVVQFLFKPGRITIIATGGFLLTSAAVFLVIRSGQTNKMKVFYYACLASILLNFYLNLVFYPKLLEYQSGIKAAEYANLNYPGEKIKTLGVLSFTIHFYAEAQTRDMQSMEDIIQRNTDSDFLLFTRESYLDSLDIHHCNYVVLESFDHYHTTMVTGTFLNQDTRQEALQKRYLLSVRLPD